MLLKELGSYAIITGERLLGTHLTYEDALRVGYAEYGIRPFLVKRIEEEESLLVFTRNLTPSVLPPKDPGDRAQV